MGLAGSLCCLHCASLYSESFTEFDPTLCLRSQTVPFFADLSRPDEFSLNHTINMYLTSEEGISLGVWFSWWLKWGLLALFVVFIVLPYTVKVLPNLIQHYVYAHRLRVPFFADLSRPDEFSLNHTINMYLTPEEGISLGVWHTVPASQWKEAQGKDLAWYQDSLGAGGPVFIYLHGNLGTRSAPHRMGVAKILSGLGYHVLVPDYRGFGDSTGEPTEDGLTTDALYLYNWVKARSRNSLIVIWGHSLGTGVATNMAVELVKQGVVLDGVILEGIFNAARQNIPFHPFIWYYWKYPGIGYLFKEPWAENKVVFPTEENLKQMRSPVLFLHSEDDHLVPISIPQQLHEVAASVQGAERVKMVTFEGSLGYLHNGLYRDPRLPGIIKEFVQSLEG
ncbi:lysophosphatidylserine lipase ABHD12 isoform X2 [Salarias fasciatus]|uniref:lysophosphatidylserine lipase ABHD12 isoform X2 n=1 Tax=Salarias fasciatus TaxID=181472 RepID=UPI001176FAD2|nr:lysophosphatidylserine lipase ABHD12-like isoform X2 [Salarias fasciatus]